MGALRFDGVNDVVSIASGMTGNVGTSLYSFRIKSGPAGITLPASGVAGFVGVTGASTSNGLATNSTGQIRVYQAGTNRYGSTGQLIFSGVAFDYTLTHNADGTWNIFNNLTGSPTGESGTFSTSLTWTGGTALNQFGRSSNSNAVYLLGDIDTIAVTGLANGQSWQADLSGGTGSTLPTASGTNQGSLVNFPTDNSQWIGFGSTITASATLDLGSFGFVVSANDTAPTFSASAAYDLGDFGFSVTASDTAPAFTATANYDLGGFGFSATANSLAPGNYASVSLDIGPFGFDVSASSSAPVFQSSAAYDLGAFGFAVSAAIINNDRQATASYDIGAFGFSAAAASTIPPVSASASYDIGAFTFSISASFPSETVEAGATITFTEKSRTISFIEQPRSIGFTELSRTIKF